MAGILRQYTGRGADSIDVRIEPTKITIECHDCLTDYEAKVLEFAPDKDQVQHLIEALRKELHSGMIGHVASELSAILSKHVGAIEADFSVERKSTHFELTLET